MDSKQGEVKKAIWTVYQGAEGSFTVHGTPIYIEGQLICIAVEPDWDSILESAVQAEVDKVVEAGEAYTEARAKGLI